MNDYRQRIHQFLDRINKEKLSIMIIVLSVVIVNVPYLFMSTFINSDEFSAIAVPAYLAGHDWSATVSMGSFHGWGFTVLFTPFFMLFDNIDIVFLLVQICVLLIKSLLGILVFRILHKQFGLDYRISVCIAVSYIVGMLAMDHGSSISVLSEIPIGGCIILSVYLWLELFSVTGKKRRFYSFLLGITMAYGYSIHSRCLIIYVSFIMVYAAYEILFRRHLVHMICFLAGMIGGLALLYFLNLLLVEGLYRTDSVHSLPNDTVNVASSLRYLVLELFDFTKLKVIFNTVFSLIGTLTLVSGGFIWFLIAGSVLQIKNAILKKDEKSQKMFIVALFGIVSCFAMLFAVALSSVGHITTGNLRWLTYIRYVKPFLVTVYIAGAAAFFARKNKKGIFIGAACGIICSVLFINTWLLDMLKAEYGLSWSLLGWFHLSEDVLLYFTLYSKAVLLFAVVFVVVIKKMPLFSFGIFILISLNFCVQQTRFNVTRSHEYKESVTASVRLLDELPEEESVTVYCDGTSRAFCNYVQFFLYDKASLVLTEYDTIDWEQTALLSDQILKDIGAEPIPIADKEYLYSSSKEFIRQYVRNG